MTVSLKRLEVTNQSCQENFISSGKNFVSKICQKSLDFLQRLNPFNFAKQSDECLSNEKRERVVVLKNEESHPAIELVAQLPLNQQTAKDSKKNIGKIDKIYQNQEQYSLLCLDDRPLTLAYVAGDVVYLYASVDQVVATVLNQETSSANTGLEYISGLNLLTGHTLLSQGYSQYRIAKKTDECWGQFFGKTKMARGALTMTNGVVKLSSHSVSIAAAQTSSKTALQAAHVLGKGGNVLSAISFTIALIPVSIALKKQVGFYREFKNHLRITESFPKEMPGRKVEQAKSRLEFLIKQLDLKDKEREQIAKEVLFQDPIEVVINRGQESPSLTPSDVLFIENFVRDKGEDKEEIRAKLEMAFKYKRLQKKVEFEFKVGAEGVERISKEIYKVPNDMFINRLLEAKSKETQDQVIEEINVLVDEIYNKDLVSLMKQNVGFILLGIILVALSIAACFVTGGAFALFIGIMWIALSLCMLGIDVKDLIKAYKEGDLEFKDRLMFTLVSFFMTVSVVLGVIFSAGLLPVIASGVIGLLYLALILYSYFNIKDKEAKKQTAALIDRDIKQLNIEA